MSTGSSGRAKAGINVTPMIDVLLVLIIIFMVIAPETSTGLPALVPQTASPDAGPPAPSTDIVISIGADHHLQLNSEVIAFEALPSRLAGDFPRRTSPPPPGHPASD